MDLNLSGKTALVTGSGKGIGEAIVRKLAAEKPVVIVHGRNKVQAEKSPVKSLRWARQRMPWSVT